MIFFLQSLVALEAKDILVVNLPPLGCMPALLTLYPGTKDKYNSHGCLTEINKISAEHNKLLGEGIVALRAKYPTVKFYYGDAHGVYTDILKDPLKYSKHSTFTHRHESTHDCKSMFVFTMWWI